MSTAKVNGLAVAEILAGVVLFWSGFKNAPLSDTLRSLLRGSQSVPTASPTTSGTPTVGVNDSASGTSSGTSSSTPAPPAPTSVSGNVALGKMMASAYQWGSGSEWNSLYDLWNRESGWNNKAQNPSSGAYGIPQALPPTKMPASAQEAGGSNAASQIAWGLSYIKDRYGDPNEAWAHEEANGWY